MKFCKKRTVEETRENLVVTINFVTYQDVEEFHGKKFAAQWLEFIKNKKTFLNNEKTCYYYSDYKDAAYTTETYLIE